MFRAFVVLVAVLVSHAVCAASIKPQVPPNERAAYLEMLKTNPKAAKEYLITREYVSQCHQVVDNPKRAVDLPNMPDDYKSGLVSKDEREIVKMALNLSIGAEIERQQKGGRR
jgi:hypothetical protein